MSFDQLRRVWVLSLSAVEKLLLLALADFADDDGKAWPSVATLSNKTGLGERTIRRGIGRLKDLGLVAVEEKDGHSNTFFLTLDPCPTGTPAPQAAPPCLTGIPTPATQAPRTYQLNQPRNPSLSSSPSGKPKATLSAPDGFAEFWKVYPKRVGKATARKAWVKAKVDGQLPTILAAIERAKGSRQWQEERGRFIPHPATWLNQGRWEDETDEAPPPDGDNRVRLN